MSLDLTGLPPTPAAVDTFVRDTSANAYEKLVDRLLASPRYGERMAFRWMEAESVSIMRGTWLSSAGHPMRKNKSCWQRSTDSKNVTVAIRKLPKNSSPTAIRRAILRWTTINPNWRRTPGRHFRLTDVEGRVVKEILA